jgi:hypothetical protein
VRIVVAAVLAAVADAMLFANRVPKLGAHVVAARPVEKIAWRQETRGIQKWQGVGVGEEKLPKQVRNNSAAVQQKDEISGYKFKFES